VCGIVTNSESDKSYLVSVFYVVYVNDYVYRPMCAGVMTMCSVCFSVKENGEEACKELMEAFAACVKSNAEAS